MWPVIGWVLPLKIVLLIFFRQFDGLLGYFGLPDLKRLLAYSVCSSGLVALVWFATGGLCAPPRSVILVDFLIAMMLMGGGRLGLRVLRERYLAPEARHSGRVKRVAIVGAGDVGSSLAREISVKRGLGMKPIAFFDDDMSKWRSRVHDIPVLGGPEALLDRTMNLRLEEVIIAMPSASAKRIGEVVKILQKARLKFQTVPSLPQLASGQVKVSQLRSVEIQDLLGRDAVKLETEHIRGVLEDKVVLVTGAGGSIGGELCRQILEFHPRRLLLLDQSEVQLFQIEQELLERGHGSIIFPLIADVLDTTRIRQIFERQRPEVVFHAAAHKHVPMMESQPSEAIKNNTFGTARLAEAARDHGVARFVMISTDKAINPTSVMGATKRVAEIFLQALHAETSGGTQFIAVHFGNVLGSSGSVIPTFQKQIALGGPVKVTHRDVTRYFMTIPEACGLVLQSCAQGQGGEIFVLDMGQPVKIVDLARQLIELNGLVPDEDILIEFTGLRPGEKLFEELSHQGEN
ncbi:MAG: polysaccharide biosynthesis protein, partial [Verrucomicrobia bacterium]|nr:polysaccharide biosynthesis protein [Verrucomicrobiota bacterium]